MSQNRQITAAFLDMVRRILGKMRFRPPKNHWYRMMLKLVQHFGCIADCEDDIQSETHILTGDEAEIRDYQQLAKKTTVVNLGPGRVSVYEDGFIVATIEAESQKTLPQKGKGRLTATSVGEAEVQVVTHLRCACGQDVFVYAEEPIGANLL